MKTFSKTPGNEKLVSINCVSCSSSEFTAWYKSDIFVRCCRCGLVYQNPQPVQADLSSRYDEIYFRYEIVNEAVFFKLMRLALDDIGFFEEIEPSFADSKRFLDVGCATGMLLEYLQTRGWKAKGVELCEASARYGQTERGLDIFIGTLEEAGMADSSFDVVHCSHLIEHLTDPVGFISICHKILKNNGYLLITTPDISGFQAKLFRQKWRSAIADHMVLYSHSGLRKMLERAGFTVLRYKTWGGVAAGVGPAWLKKIMDFLAKKLGFGDVMIMAARKDE